MGFKLVKPLEKKKKKQCAQSLWQWSGSFALDMTKTRWEKCQVCFSDIMAIGAGICSLSKTCLASRKLLASFFVEFVTLTSGNDLFGSLGATFPVCEKKAF